MPNLSSGLIEEAALAALAPAGCAPGVAQVSAWACGWLESVGYPGLSMLAEALETTPREGRQVALSSEYGLVDTGNVSCVFIAAQLLDMARAQGRVVLMQARHGLYLLPFSVAQGIGIGCPVDPSFALGGVRERNPYLEKLARSAEAGIEVAPDVLERLAKAV
ncbi:MAG: hypothetical protein NWR47_03200 [Aestuariivirgaceae bacterium]|nr:hypothetical protein [Aestuariivirgaceae bacterium]